MRPWPHERPRPAARSGPGPRGVTVRAASRGVTLAGGPGAAIGVDRRGRMPLPVWLRHACGPGGAVAVATRLGEQPVVLVAPPRVLDGLADVLVGEQR